MQQQPKCSLCEGTGITGRLVRVLGERGGYRMEIRDQPCGWCQRAAEKAEAAKLGKERK